MEYKNNILELVGNTPLIKLNKLNTGLKPLILAKLESSNPGGSVKDRIGLAIIEDAERSGKLKAGGTVIEATGGNSGIGIALTAAVKGYKCIFVVPKKTSVEKINYLKAMGAKVIVTPLITNPDDPEYYLNAARKIHEQTSNSIFLSQFTNQVNPKIHYESTGPEIWRQTGGNITHFIAGIGTGGTISGTARYLKEKNSKIQVIGVEPEGSVYKHYMETGEVVKAKPYLVEGIGQSIIQANVQFQYIDRIIRVTDKESFDAASRLAQEEGIFSGGSTGAILKVTLTVAKECSEDDLIVFIVCDTGERYLSKFYNEDWIEQNRINIDAMNN